MKRSSARVTHQSTLVAARTIQRVRVRRVPRYPLRRARTGFVNVCITQDHSVFRHFFAAPRRGVRPRGPRRRSSGRRARRWRPASQPGRSPAPSFLSVFGGPGP
jgi:hypothetical protein